MGLVRMLFPRISKEKDTNKREEALARRLVAKYIHNYPPYSGEFVTNKDHEEIKARALKYKF